MPGRKKPSSIPIPNEQIDYGDSEIAQLRKELHNYHIEVTEYLATKAAMCESHRKQTELLSLQINGTTPPNDSMPGLKSDVDSLKHSRVIYRRVLKAAWIIVTGGLGLLFSWRASQG